MARLIEFKKNNWHSNLHDHIYDIISLEISNNRRRNIFLTGGNSIKSFYNFWGKQKSFKDLKKVDFYFSDERFVKFNSIHSNYNMTLTTLFKEGIPNDCKLHRIEVEKYNTYDAADHYSYMLPKQVDLMIFSLGIDGHIASLFPYSANLKEKDRMFIHSESDFHKFERVTASPALIKKANNSLIVVKGKEKKQVMMDILHGRYDKKKYPASLLSESDWIFVT
jgi:6-phosphogluconolactonase